MGNGRAIYFIWLLCWLLGAVQDSSCIEFANLTDQYSSSSVRKERSSYDDICGDLPRQDPMYTISDDDDEVTSSGLTVTVRCAQGYSRIRGSKLYKCYRAGRWTVLPGHNDLECRALTCKRDSILNGQILPVSGTMFHNGENITYACSENYRLVGDRVRTCHNGTWSGQPAICQAIKCGSPKSLDHGWVSHNMAYNLGEMVQYRCNAGYRLVGLSNRTCLADETWSGQVPACKPVDCGKPIHSGGNFTLFQQTTTYRSTAEFSCYSTPTKKHWIYCNNLGEWKPYSYCPENCSKPNVGFSVFANGATSGHLWRAYTPHGGNAPVQCTSGKVLSCNDGYWVPKVRICLKGRRCRDPRTSECQVNKTGLVEVSDAVSFSAHPNQMLFGATSVTCQWNGIWMPRLPECLYSCQMPNINGSVITSTQQMFPHDHQLHINCTTAHVLVGYPVLECQNGTWYPSPPKCIIHNLSQVGKMVQKQISSGTFKALASPLITSIGLIFSMNISRRVVKLWLFCLLLFPLHLTESLPRPCTGLSCLTGCSRPPTFNDKHPIAPTRASYGIGAVVAYTCGSCCRYAGGSSSSICNADGEWTQPTLNCRHITCLKGILSNGLILPLNKVVFLPEEAVHYNCSENYQLTGPVIRTCQKDGIWSGSDTQCKAVTCNPPTSPQHGWFPFKTEFDVGETVTYVCNHGYIMVGEDQRTCLSNSTWSGSLPVCKIVDCGFPDLNINYTLLRGTTTYQSALNFRCTCEHEMTRWACCNLFGKWTPPVKCANSVNVCGSPPSPALKDERIDGRLRFPAEATVRFMCAPGYKYMGGTKVYTCCQRTRRWRAVTNNLVCEEHSCEKESLQNGNVHPLRKIFDHGENITYNCFENYCLVGDRVRTCQNRTWSGQPATCQAVVRCDAPRTTNHGRFSPRKRKEMYDIGEGVKYTCNQDYVLHGNQNQTCMADGTWSGDTPTCIIGVPQLPTHQTLKSSASRHESTLIATFILLVMLTSFNHYK